MKRYTKNYKNIYLHKHKQIFTNCIVCYMCIYMQGCHLTQTQKVVMINNISSEKLKVKFITSSWESQIYSIDCVDLDIIIFNNQTRDNMIQIQNVYKTFLRNIFLRSYSILNLTLENKRQTKTANRIIGRTFWET